MKFSVMDAEDAALSDDYRSPRRCERWCGCHCFNDQTCVESLSLQPAFLQSRHMLETVLFANSSANVSKVHVDLVGGGLQLSRSLGLEICRCKIDGACGALKRSDEDAGVWH